MKEVTSQQRRNGFHREDISTGTCTETPQFGGRVVGGGCVGEGGWTVKPQISRRGGNGPVRHSRTKAASDSGGTTPISSRNFPPAGVGMSCGDVGAVTALMGCGGRVSDAVGGNRLPLSSENIGAVSTGSLRPPRGGRSFPWSRLS